MPKIFSGQTSRRGRELLGFRAGVIAVVSGLPWEVSALAPEADARATRLIGRFVPRADSEYREVLPVPRLRFFSSALR